MHGHAHTIRRAGSFLSAGAVENAWWKKKNRIGYVGSIDTSNVIKGRST
jgi:hypothetical protein